MQITIVTKGFISPQTTFATGNIPKDGVLSHIVIAQPTEMIFNAKSTAFTM